MHTFHACKFLELFNQLLQHCFITFTDHSSEYVQHSPCLVLYHLRDSSIYLNCVILNGTFEREVVNKRDLLSHIGEQDN